MTLSTIEDSPTMAYVEVNDEAAFAKRGCCSCFPFAGRGGSGTGGTVFWERINHSGGGEGPWWTRGWRRLREWSDLIAGPKLRTLGRRIGRRKGGAGGGGGGKFQYDAMSYSLNFDEGGQSAASPFADEYYRRGFSSRYSLPPSARSSMDFDKEGLSFT